MGKLKNFIRNYIYHPKSDKVTTYAIGAIDGLGLLNTTHYIRGTASADELFTISTLVVLAHLVGCEQGRRNEAKESHLAEITSS
jgi:hypothetical protein